MGTWSMLIIPVWRPQPSPAVGGQMDAPNAVQKIPVQLV